jgi:uncharacterized membrane protein
VILLPLEAFFVGGGLVLASVAGVVACDRGHPRRWGSAAFWLLLAIAMGGGRWLSEATVGYLVLLLTLLAATRQVSAPLTSNADPAGSTARATRLRDRLLVPVLLVPFVTVAGSLTLDRITWNGGSLVKARQLPQVALALGCVVGLVAAMRLTREGPVTVAREGGRLLQVIGWTLILPQMLAALGGILGRAGVGDVIAELVAAALPVQDPLVAVLAYCGGMAAFTILLGNAFAAFPVITLGIGLPFVVLAHGGNPAVMGALGMLSGYCGTLVTPMAANFNLVPVRLLELPDDWAVIRAQVPFAAVIWIFNVVVMYLCVYRF